MAAAVDNINAALSSIETSESKADTLLGNVKALKPSDAEALKCQEWIVKTYSPLHGSCEDAKAFLQKRKSFISNCVPQSACGLGDSDRRQVRELASKVREPVYSAMKQARCDGYLSRMETLKPGAPLPQEMKVLADGYKKLLDRVNSVHSALSLLAE